MDCSPPGSSVHGILQARTLDWVAMPSSRESSQPRSAALQAASLPSELPGKPVNINSLLGSTFWSAAVRTLLCNSCHFTCTKYSIKSLLFLRNRLHVMKYGLSYETLNLTCANITPLLARVSGCGEFNGVDSSVTSTPLSPWDWLTCHSSKSSIYLIMFCFRTTKIILHFVYDTMVIQNHAV